VTEILALWWEKQGSTDPIRFNLTPHLALDLQYLSKGSIWLILTERFA